MMRFGFGYTIAPGDLADPSEVTAAIAQFSTAQDSLLATWNNLLKRCNVEDSDQIASFLWGRTQSVLNENNPNSEMVIIRAWASDRSSFTEAMLSRLRNAINEMIQINAELGSVTCPVTVVAPTASTLEPIPLVEKADSGLIWILGLVVLGIVLLKR